MKALHVNTGWLRETQYLSDHALADASYEALKKAMSEYEQYGNDRQKTVTIGTGNGCSATYRLESLVAIAIDDLSTAEADIIERTVWEAQLKAKVAARLAPSTTEGL